MLDVETVHKMKSAMLSTTNHSLFLRILLANCNEETLGTWHLSDLIFTWPREITCYLVIMMNETYLMRI